MEKDTEKTVVIFRKFPNGEVIALFPEIPESRGNCLSYMHIGQHGGADYFGLLSKTKLATSDEYKDLQEELESLGYNLKIQKRWMRR